MFNNLKQRLYRRFKREYLGWLCRKHKKSVLGSYSILEIGSLKGEASVILARYGHVTTLELNPTPELLKRIEGKNITLIQGNSMEILPKLETKFDFIYVDGSHHYTETKHDLENSIRLLKPGGIIVGDDFDRTKDEIDPVHAESVKETDVTSDYLSKGGYHPGVTLAVADVLGRNVNKVPHTFFAVRKIGDSFVNAFPNLNEQ